jgi:hypothetical protein
VQELQDPVHKKISKIELNIKSGFLKMRGILRFMQICFMCHDILINYGLLNCPGG